MAAADSVSCHHSDNRFGAGAHLALEIQYIQMVGAFAIRITGIAADSLVAAGTERFVAFASENDHSNFLIHTSVMKRL